MNTIFRNHLTNILTNKIYPIKDIFTLPNKIYSNTKYNKNNNKNKNNKKIYIPKKIKINTNNFKYNKKNKPINIPHAKETIPKRIRELVWTTNNSETFSHKCYVSWCDNNINVFNFQVGHDIPESKGGTLDIDNLKPICGSCNLSMSNKYTITEWSKLIDINHSKYNKNINDDNKLTLITKIKNILPTLPTITLLGFIFNSFRYLKV